MSPLAWVLMKIGGSRSYNPPGPFETLHDLQKPTTVFKLIGRLFWDFPFQVLGHNARIVQNSKIGNGYFVRHCILPEES